jgi:hypothetical protein
MKQHPSTRTKSSPIENPFSHHHLDLFKVNKINLENRQYPGCGKKTFMSLLDRL